MTIRRERIIVDNRSGASGALAVEATVNANPDGHTILLITNSQAVGQASGVKVPYDLHQIGNRKVDEAREEHKPQGAVRKVYP